MFTKLLSSPWLKGVIKMQITVIRIGWDWDPWNQPSFFFTSHVISATKPPILMLDLSELVKLKWITDNIHDSIITVIIISFNIIISSLYNTISIHGTEAEYYRIKYRICWSFIIMNKALSILANFDKTQKSFKVNSLPHPYILFIFNLLGVQETTGVG